MVVRLKIAFTIEDVIGTLGDLPGIIGFRCHIPGFVAPRHFEVLVASLNELVLMFFRKVCDSIVSRYDYIKFVNNESQLLMDSQKR